MSLPIACITSMHVCPMVTVVVPHVGGPIAQPCVTVLAGGLPVATATSMCVCVGPPDLIAMGSTMVLAGGLPVAKMTSQNGHGGLIVSPGSPMVLVGG
ncbi:PAAR domain-containing protein [Pelagibaculum spongiae]|uniref:Type VI secretion protein n=1 Tax=Pelagibaculum spongiae TaxID=2080658 RepID=A0A2V1GRQ4_9GAMM|nr:PAAR domain-containing protein [Pelagibaculum spongiae]PVZ67681.1 type VI secretion protein [Pelagibaculum spongiae]